MEQTTLTVGTEKNKNPHKHTNLLRKITTCCLSIKFNSHYKYQQCLIPAIKIIISHFFFNKATYFAVTRGNKSNNSASLDSHATDNNRDNRLSKPRFKTDTKV